MNAMLEDLVGQRVYVWSVSGERMGVTDEGILEGFEYPWLRLRKGDGEILCFSVYRVRLVKGHRPLEGDTHVVAA